MRTVLAKKQYRDWQFGVYHCAMTALRIDFDRARRTPLAAQIYWAIRERDRAARLGREAAFLAGFGGSIV
jgi:hypothetical protein